MTIASGHVAIALAVALAAVALTVRQFRGMLGWALCRAVAWITSLTSLGVVLANMTANLLATMSWGVLPRRPALVATVGYAVAASLSYVPAWPVATLAVLSAVGGVGGAVWKGTAPEEPPASGVPRASFFVAPPEESSEVEAAANVLKAPLHVATFLVEGLFGIVATIVKFPLDATKALVLLFCQIVMTFTSELRSYESAMWTKVYGESPPFYEPTDETLDLPETHYSNELWMYVNGINTDVEGAKRHCRHMYDMFGRPVGLLYNPTHGIVPDLMECAAGKTGLLKFGVIGPQRELMRVLEEKLRGAKDNGIEKIVLIAHSQGTIIAGNAISNLGRCEDGEEVVDEELYGLMKELLEVYIVAGAAHHMPMNCKHLECLSNGGDLVAWLGHMFPDVLKPTWRNTWFRGIYYDCEEGKNHGENHIELDNWGHSFYKHYLQPMKYDGKFAKSKLALDYMSKKDAPQAAGEETPLVTK